MKPIANETILLNEIAKGSEKAFKRLFYAYNNQLGEFVFSITGSYENTEEIIHDVFLKIWTNREELDQIQNFTSYLFILTRNYTLNCVRKMASQHKKALAYEKEATASNNTTEQESEQEPDYQMLVENAIRQLPPQQQKVFILRQKGLKNMEIARMMGIAPGSVKKYQQWALKSISEFLKSDAAFSYLILFLLSPNL